MAATPAAAAGAGRLLADSAFTAAGPLRVPMDHQGRITGKAGELVLRCARPRPNWTARAPAVRHLRRSAVPAADRGGPERGAGAAKPALTVLLVAVAGDARADRIASFLQDRGCRPTVDDLEHGDGRRVRRRRRRARRLAGCSARPSRERRQLPGDEVAGHRRRLPRHQLLERRRR